MLRWPPRVVRLLVMAPMLVLGGVAAGAQARAAHIPATLPIESLGKGTAIVGGPWQFHTGDDLAWATQSLDDSQWPTISADQPWGAQPGFKSYTGSAWYRRHITITAASGVEPSFALLIEDIDDAYEIYWNGALVGSSGKLPPHPTWYNSQPAQTFGLPYVLSPSLMPAGSNVLAVRVWKAPYVSYDNGQQGGFESPPLIGSPEAIAAYKASLDYDWLRSRQLIFAIDCLYALVALLSVITWLRNRKAWVLFWMAGFSLAPLAILFLDGLRLKIPFALSLGVQQPLYSLEDISLWCMLLWFLNLEDSRTLRRGTWIFAIINLCCTSLDGLLTAVAWGPSWGSRNQLADGLLSAVYTTTEIWPLLIITYAVMRAITMRRRLDPARWLVAISAFLSVTTSGLQVVLAQGRRYTHWGLERSPLLATRFLQRHHSECLQSLSHLLDCFVDLRGLPLLL